MPSVLDRTEGDIGLGQLQRWFHGRVIGPSLSGEAQATAGLVAAATLREPDEVVRPSAGLTPERRMAIYADMYLIRIFEALAEDYPTVRAMVGDEQLKMLARAYVTRFPSRSYTLAHTGNDLPEYLAAAEDLEDGPLLADVARLERAVNRSFHAASSEVLAPSVVGQVPVERWPELRFRLGAAVEVLAFDHPANDLVSAVHRGEPLTRLSPQPSWTVVWRKDFVVWRQALSEPRYALLAALRDGATMAAAVDATQAVWPGPEQELEQELFEWFADWLQEGLFAAVVLPPDRAQIGATLRPLG
mgnify:CR=1 FL=1